MQENALYGTLARYYDQIYYWKDYQKEAIKIKSLVRKYKSSHGNNLLDVACGTGKHLSYLREDFSCVGVDISNKMLEVAKQEVRGVRFVRGSMTDFSLGRRFDIILCLFSSMGYLATRKDGKKAVANFAKHLEEGGLLIIEPWIRKSEWRDRTVHMQRYDGDSLKIARLNFGRSEGAFSILDEVYLIGAKGKGITIVRDRHRMRFFELGQTLEALRKVGLDARFTKESLMPGRGLIIATKTD